MQTALSSTFPALFAHCANTDCFLLSAEISTVLCDNQNKAETLLQTREKGQTPVLKTVVIMDPFNSELVERGTKCGVEIVSLEDVEVLHTRRNLCLVSFQDNCCSSVLLEEAQT